MNRIPFYRPKKSLRFSDTTSAGRRLRTPALPSKIKNIKGDFGMIQKIGSS
jgi:hypothetical protein